MSAEIYRYAFGSTVDFDEVEATYVLAVLGAESLHGETQVRLDAAHALDSSKRALVIDATTTVGRDLNRLFLGFARREFGADSFRLERVTKTEVAACSAAA